MDGTVLPPPPCCAAIILAGAAVRAASDRGVHYGVGGTNPQVWPSLMRERGLLHNASGLVIVSVCRDAARAVAQGQRTSKPSRCCSLSTTAFVHERLCNPPPFPMTCLALLPVARPSLLGTGDNGGLRVGKSWGSHPSCFTAPSCCPITASSTCLLQAALQDVGSRHPNPAGVADSDATYRFYRRLAELGAYRLPELPKYPAAVTI